MIISNAHSFADFQRRTSSFIENTSVTSTISVSLSPQISCGVNFVFSTSQTGTVTITGTKDSVSITEEVVLSSTKIGVGMKSFDTISSIGLSSGIVSGGGTLTAKYVGLDGGSVEILQTIKTGWPIQMVRKNASFPALHPGTVQQESPKALVFFDDSFSPRDADIITLKRTGEKFTVVGTPFFEQVGINQHWVVNLKKYSG